MLYILCIQNHLLHFKLLNNNRHMSCVTKSFIDKIQEFKDIGSTEALKTGIGLTAATILMHLVAGALPSRARILLLLT